MIETKQKIIIINEMFGTKMYWIKSRLIQNKLDIYVNNFCTNFSSFCAKLANFCTKTANFCTKFANNTILKQ